VYAALGDSYAAGPLIPTTEANTGCFRSDHNYASLLAESLHIKTVRDATCSAAETKDLTRRQLTLANTRVPPQLEAVTADTDLVTVGIGGNDFALFSTGLRDGKAGPGVVRRIGARVAGALRRIHAKAPHAHVVLVGYPRLVDRGTSCPNRLPFSAANLAAGYAVQVQLNDVMRKAAAETGSTYVDLFASSKGHGICSRHPWVNGAQTLRGRAAAYHPFAVEMRAAARAIEDAL
jgi:lysophospholipase L1-like esterase